MDDNINIVITIRNVKKTSEKIEIRIYTFIIYSD